MTTIRLIRFLRDLFDVDWDNVGDGQVLTRDGDTITGSDPGGGGAPTDGTYLVTTANGTLSAEVVVGATPGGELGGTWASPTVDATHSGSSHADVQAAAEATAAAALSAHVTDASDAHDATAVSFAPAGSIAATDVQAAIEEVAADVAASGAPNTADYLVGTAQGGLSAEIVVGTSPGGELGGTWASPTVDATHSGSSHASVQAAAEATAQAALDAHLNDAADAHDASAISIADAGGDFTATTVEGALDELQADHEADVTALSDHIADASAAHAASAISADSTTLVGTGTTAQAVFEELDNAIVAAETATANHLADATAAHAASAISASSTTLSGTGTDVQAVLEELDNLLDDHSARHENGGADEISIAGLDGTPTELTNHLNDATDAHDASAISVLDTNGDYTATDVEGVLAEIAPQLGGGSAAFSGARVEGFVVVPDSTDTAVVFDNPAIKDTDGYYDSGDPERLTIPETGTYNVGALVGFDIDGETDVTDASVVIRRFFDGGLDDEVIARWVPSPVWSDATPRFTLETGPYDFVAGDWVVLEGSQSQTVPTDAELAGTFWIQKASSGPEGPAGDIATASLWDAKGDLAVGTGANTAQKLTAGANGTVPTYQSAETTGILPQFPPGYELGYAQITSSGTSTQTSQASATTILTAPSITFDGSTTVLIHVFTERLSHNVASLTSAIIDIWQDSTDLATAARITASAASIGGAVSAFLRITPSAGAKVYTARLWLTNAGTATVLAGAGTGGAPAPAFIRITKV